jgi:hypothetical protein
MKKTTKMPVKKLINKTIQAFNAFQRKLASAKRLSVLSEKKLKKTYDY